MTPGRFGVRALVLGSIVVCAAGCGRGHAAPPADPLAEVFQRQAREEGLSRMETDGKRVFGHYCVTCHGETGEGDGQNAFNVDPKPPNFRESLKAHPSSYWRQVIEGGTAAVGRSSQCPPWGRTLTSGDIDALIAYLNVLAGRSAAGSPAARRP